MQDPKLQELTNAYLLHEIEYEEYRRLRTEYIDEITGYEAKEEEKDDSDDTIENIEPPESKNKPTTSASVILFISLTVTALILFWVLTDLGK